MHIMIMTNTSEKTQMQFKNVILESKYDLKLNDKQALIF